MKLTTSLYAAIRLKITFPAPFTASFQKFPIQYSLITNFRRCKTARLNTSNTHNSTDATTNCDTVHCSTSVSTARSILRDTCILYCTDTSNNGTTKLVPVDAMKAYGSGGILPHVLNPDIRWKEAFRLTPRPLYSDIH